MACLVGNDRQWWDEFLMQLARSCAGCVGERRLRGDGAGVAVRRSRRDSRMVDDSRVASVTLWVGCGGVAKL